MNKDENDNDNDYEKDWSLTIGFYPGVLFGLRTYNEPGYVTWVLYLPFVDIALEIDI